jgi:MFS family permease
MLVFAMPALSLPVLFSEIAAELDLSIVQVGMIWGIGSFTGMFVVLIGGTIGDRFGTRKTLIIVCCLTGIFGAVRGLSFDFTTFLATSFLFGLVQPALPVNLHKVAREWFPSRQLGLATGIISAGFGTGLMLGSLLSATVFSPALGGWQRVLYLYGIVAVVVSGLWFIVHPGEVDAADRSEPGRRHIPFRVVLSHVARLRTVWIVGLGALCIWACIRGFVGYLPTYLRDIGWSGSMADGALSAFYAVSLVAAVPLAMLSDRFHIRRGFLLIAALMMGTGVVLLSVAEGILILGAVLIAGIVFDAYMAIYQTTIMEVEGVGVVYAGTALGFGSMLREVGGVFSPPLGNSLTALGPSAPFAFWGAMGLLAMLAFYMIPVKEDETTVKDLTR